MSLLKKISSFFLRWKIHGRMIESKYLPAALQKFIIKTTCADYVRFDILQLINKEKILPPDWEIKITEGQLNRATLQKPMGYLLLPEKQEKDILSDMVKLIHKQIEKKKHISTGLANLIIICDRLGNLTDSEQTDLIEEITKNLSIKEYTEIIKAIILQLNQEYYSYRNDKSKEPANVKEWDDIIFREQYTEPFDNPIELLATLKYLRKEKLDMLDLVTSLSPLPRAAAIQHRISYDNKISDKQLIAFLNKHLEEVPFVGSLIFNTYDENTLWITDNLVTYLLSEHWLTTGKFIFRKIFSSSRKNISKPVEETVKNATHDFLVRKLCTENIDISFVIAFEFPDDYEAFGGWRYFTNKEIAKEFLLSPNVKESLASNFANVLVQTAHNIPEFISETKNIFQNWLHDIVSLNSRYATIYTAFSWLSCNQEQWGDCEKVFGALCFQIKTLFYGSYQANYLGKRLSEYLLTFVLSASDLKDLNEQDTLRIQTLLKKMENSFLFSFLRFAERERLIWDNKNYEPNYYSDKELSLVLGYIREINSDEKKRNIYKSLIEKINEWGTVEWSLENVKEN